MLFYANSLIVIEFCHDSIKKINFLEFFDCHRILSRLNKEN